MLGFVLILGGWWLTSCGSLPKPEEGILDVWVAWAEGPEELQALFDRYSQSSGVPVRVITRVRSDDVLEALAGTEHPDLVVLNNGELVESYNQQGLLEPLDRWIEACGIDLEDIYPAALARCKVPDGGTVCLPWGSDTYALYWNKDLFAAAGLNPEQPPQTMEELVEYSDKLTVRGESGELVQVGFIPDMTRSHAELYARMFGGSRTNDDGTELNASAQPVVDAADWQRQFYDRYGSGDVKQFVSSLNLNLDSRHPVSAGKRLSCQQCHVGTVHKKDPSGAFYAGKVAMMVGGEWQVTPNFISELQPELNYGVASFPPPAGHPERSNTTVVQGPVAIIPAGVRDKAAAADLLAWMMSPEILAEEMHAIFKLPTSRKAARDPRFRQIPDFGLFMDLLAHPNAQYAATTAGPLPASTGGD